MLLMSAEKVDHLVQRRRADAVLHGEGEDVNQFRALVTDDPCTDNSVGILLHHDPRPLAYGASVTWVRSWTLVKSSISRPSSRFHGPATQSGRSRSR